MSLFRRSEEERQLLSFYRPWYRRPSVWLAISLPALLLARLALTPLAWYEVHKRLASLPDYEVSFSSLSLAILRKQIIFRNVKVHHRGQGGGKDGDALATIPFVQIDVPLWRLVRGGPVEAITLIDPVFRLRTDAALALDQQAKLAWAHSARPLPLSEIKNLRIERGTVLAAEQQGSPQANDRALFRELDIVISGLGFGNQGVADVVHARVNGGLMIGSGITKGQAEFTRDHERSWNFEGELFVAGLDVQDLQRHAFAPAAVPEAPSAGKFRVKATFQGKRGQLTAQFESEVQGAYTLSDDARKALQAKALRDTAMTVWVDGARVQAALPGSIAPVRIAAAVPAIVFAAAGQALKTTSPPLAARSPLEDTPVPKLDL